MLKTYAVSVKLFGMYFLISVMNSLNQTESAVFKLYNHCKCISEVYLVITATAVVLVAAVKRLPRTSI